LYKTEENKWLPTSKKEVEQRGWSELDVILFSGDAYVDHPSFGAAVIGRILEAEGLRVAIVPQPNWRDDLRDFKKLGVPRLFFGISAGCMDSMVNHYTANKRLRSNDAYTPGGVSGFRPDYTTIVYSTILKKIFPQVPVIIGGIEASMRRFTHYDYWSDQLKKSILVDSKADMLVYGMGEKSIVAIARALKAGQRIQTLQWIPQTGFCLDVTSPLQPINGNTITLFSHEACLADKRKSAENFKVIEEESNKMVAARLLQRCDDKLIVVNPPYETWSQEEIDATYELPFTRLPHPRYKEKRIPAYEMIRFSVNTHRGCFGGCSFCTISMHQGKQVLSRSEKSIFKEIKKISELPDFKGILTDLGGPSANMYGMKGKNLNLCKVCKRPSCIFPQVCHNLDRNHARMTNLYRKVDQLPYIKKSFIGSGIRYDLLLSSDPHDENSLNEYMEEVIQHHVSGRLKVAPEHTSTKVLALMRKPSFDLFREFQQKFEAINRKANLNQQLIPYFISSHPGCSNIDMAELAIITKSMNFKLEQVQDFTPTPMTLSTEMFYSGINPYTGESVKTAKLPQEKMAQQQFFFWYKPSNQNEIKHELKKAGRPDLIDKLIGKNVYKSDQAETPKAKKTSKKMHKK
jgi:uncharacterized radical SAM protein YgiQ